MMKNLALLAVASSMLVPGASAQIVRVSPVESASASGGSAASAASALVSRAPRSLSPISIGAASLPLSAAAPAASALAPAAAPAAAAAALAASAPAAAPAAVEASRPVPAPASARAKTTAAPLARPIAAVANASVLAHFAVPASQRDASLEAERIGALYGESQAAAAADGPEVAANAGGAAARSHLAPAASPAASAERSAAPAAPTIAEFAGTWSRVSGSGYDRVEVTASRNRVSVRGEKYGVHDFNGINAPTTNDKPWRGSSDAPGGLVTRSVTTVFKDGRLEETSFRVEKPMLAWPTALLETTSLSMSGGRLVLRTEATLYRRTFFYFGPFNVKTRLNTTNLADPARPLAEVVYARAGSAPAAPAREPATAMRGPASSPSVLVKTAVAAAYAAAASPLLAATPAAAAANSHPVLKVGAGAVVGAVAGFSATAGIYHFRHRNDPHGDFDFSILGDLFFGLIGAVAGGIAGAVIGAAL